MFTPETYLLVQLHSKATQLVALWSLHSANHNIVKGPVLLFASKAHVSYKNLNVDPFLSYKFISMSRTKRWVPDLPVQFDDWLSNTSMQLRAGNSGVLISELSLILTVRGTDSDQEDTFTYSIHDYANWLEYTIRLGLPWHANYPLGKEDTCLQEKKQTNKQTTMTTCLESGCTMQQEQKIPISKLWPSSAMKHIQSIQTAAANHYYLGWVAATKTGFGPQFKGKIWLSIH